MLSTGRILVAGGMAVRDGGYLASCELFDPGYRTVSFTVNDSLRGTVNGTLSQVVAKGGSTSTVTAVPTTGYSFSNWSGTNGFATTSDNPLIVSNVQSDMTITANFVVATYTLHYAASANGSLEGATDQTVNHGASGTAVTVVPDEHHHFANWSDGSTSNPRTDSNVTANIAVTANFAIDTFTLAYSAGGHGSLSGETAQTVDYGTSGTAITAVPATGYHFVNWSDGSTSNPRADSNVTANLSVTASFSIDTFSLAYSAGAHGTLTG